MIITDFMSFVLLLSYAVFDGGPYTLLITGQERPSIVLMLLYMMIKSTSSTTGQSLLSPYLK